MELELNVFDEDVENPISENPILESKTETEWTDDIEEVLNNILENCSLISEHHKKEYIQLQNTLKYFKIPVITISAVNSVFSFALLAWLSQTSVTSVNCFLSLICSIISSIELYLNISKRSDVELISYKKYYLLSIKINSILKLNFENRTPSPKLFLCEIINEYNTLFNESNVNGLGSLDKLLVFKTPIL